MIEASSYRKCDNGNVTCFLCAHRCHIPSGGFGICGTRKNLQGTLHTFTFGRLIASNVDPVEKKPLYHFLPGSSTYSIAAPGCNFRCGFCQNWEISQVRGNALEKIATGLHRSSPEEVVAEALENGCKSISFTYTEPTVFYEFMKITSTIAKESGLKTVMVTNGYMSKEITRECSLFIDAFNIDLKSFSEKFYRENCGASLKPILENISYITSNGNWLELTTLLIPGKNDSIEEIGAAAEFIDANNSAIPWHLSRFFPRYQFNNYKPTPVESINDAYKIGYKFGLNYVYRGNVEAPSITSCPKCKSELIVRHGFLTQLTGLKNGKCASCGRIVEGMWS